MKIITSKLALCFFLLNTLAFGKMTNVDFLRHYAKISKEGDVSYLLSNPGSGNTLVRYIFEFVAGRPTMELVSHHSLINIFLSYSFKELKVNLYAKPLWKSHRNRSIQAQTFYDKSKTHLVLVVRNYKEIAFRYSYKEDLPLFDADGHLIEDNLRKVLSIWDGDDTRELYFANIAFFDQIPKERRMLIYYEDLIQHPFGVIEQITTFFDGSQERKEALINEYDYYKKRIHHLYDKEETVLSNVDDVRFYSRNYSFEQCKVIDDWVKRHHAVLWYKYLSRYEESRVRN